MTVLLDETHDPARTSFVASANGHPDFPIQNLPFGVFAPHGEVPRGGVAIGDAILDLAAAARSARLSGEAQTAADAASGPTLNALLALPLSARRALRRALSELLATGSAHADEVSAWLHPATDCALHLPARIGDYTDFYAGIHHAMNVGRQFRPDNPLLANYKHVPIGYHGRASSVRASGAPVRRPSGQKAPAAGSDLPGYGPTQRLDLELELGIWVGQANALGEPLTLEAADAAIAGLCLLNDWSARDLQAWEYQPLGPFLAKNFLTTVSPWIITAEALAPFRCAQPPRPAEEPRPLPYLWSEADQANGAYAIELEAYIQTAAMTQAGLAPHRISLSSTTHLYWTLAQLATHHASNGCDLQPGDLLGTGTISAPDDSGLGSLLEITRGGAQPLTLPNGERVSFLQDGDAILLRGRASAPGAVSIGFGDCFGRVGSVAVLDRQIHA
jgi:fumarylacetoacetase